MAITIESTIVDHLPVYNPMDIVVSSDNLTETDFKYIFDIQVKGRGTVTVSTGTATITGTSTEFQDFYSEGDVMIVDDNEMTISTISSQTSLVVSATPTFNATDEDHYLRALKIKKNPEPKYKYGHVDPHRVLEAFVTSDIDIQAVEEIRPCPNSYVAYRVKFGEEYQSGGVLTEFPNLTHTGDRWAWNMALDDNEFVDYDEDNYLYNGSSGFNLTNRPQTLNVDRNQEGWNHIIQDNSPSLSFYTVLTFSSNPTTLLGSYQIANNYSYDASDYDTLFLRLPMGPATIAKVSSGDITVGFGALPIMTDDVDWYSFDGLGALDYAHIMKDDCGGFENKVVHFFGKPGGYDTYLFQLAVSESTKIRARQYERSKGEVQSDGSVLYTKQEKGTVQYSKEYDDTIRLTSDWIKDDDAEWLKELFTSTDVYLEEDGELVSVKMDENGYTIRKRFNEGLTNITVKLKYDTSRRQRG